MFWKDLSGFSLERNLEWGEQVTEKIGASYDAGSWVKGSPGRAEEKQSEIATKGSRGGIK